VRMIDIRLYEMMVRLISFGRARAERFAATSAGGKLFALLGIKVGELDPHIVEQASSKKAAQQTITTKNAARDRMRELLLTLTRTAKLVTAGTPGLENTFRLSKTRSDQRLVAEARGIVKDATPFGDAIVSQHLPSTFLSDVTSAIDEFQAAIQAHAAAKESRAAATAGIDDRLAAALTIVEQLDTIVANEFASDATALAEWKSARHVSRVSTPYPVRKQHPEPAPVPPPVPQPA